MLSLRLCDICSAPCFPGAALFTIPEPGDAPADFWFARERDRDFYATVLNNHPQTRRAQVNPRVAIIGLSPAMRQIANFAVSYRRHRDYGRASMEAAFSGDLDADIIAMMDGLGLTAKLGISFPQTSFAEHPDIWVTSVVACATLKDGKGSDTWNPLRYDAAKRCISRRLIPELLAPTWTRLRAVVMLGTDGRNALEKTRMPDGSTAMDSLRRSGKLVLCLPHPSGSNGEMVALAKSADRFPSKEAFVARKLAEYRARPATEKKQTEAEYAGRRETAWSSVDDLRRQIERLSAAPV